MKRASITEAKNGLSSLLDHVRQGETVIIEDRGVPVARIESMLTAESGGEGRLARLERQGLLRLPHGPVPKRVLATAPPRLRSGASLSDAVISERRDGR